MEYRATLLVRCAAAALVAGVFMPATAQAQDGANENVGQADQAGADAATAPGTIIVTARRREEQLTDVPVSVVAFNEETLQAKGIERVDDLQIATPSIRMIPTAGRRANSQYEIRGMSGAESLVTIDPAVGIYVNDVYLARATGTNQSFYDIANVQVLYGPQGTLFGRNTTAGAVLINTNAPTDYFEGMVSAGIGNLDRYEVTGMLNVPVSDSLALRFAGQRVKRDGYYTNLSAPSDAERLGSNDTWSGRASARLSLGGFENTTVFSYFESDEKSTPLVVYGVRNPSPALQAAFDQQQSLGFYAGFHDAALRDYSAGNDTSDLINGFVNNPNGYERAKTITVTNTTSIDLSDSLTVKNIFGYHDVRFDSATDFDGTPLKLVDTWYRQKSNQVSNELQLQGDIARFNWVVGALYFRENGSDVQNSVQLQALATHQRLEATNESIAVFAQGTYEIVDDLSVTLGARYSWDERTAVYDNPTRSLLVGPAAGVVSCSIAAVAPPGTCFVELDKSFSEPTWTASLDWKVSPDILLYAAHRHGYRSGGFNARVPAAAVALNPFEAETVNDVELGFKGQFELGGGARAFTNLAVYQAWYTGLQQSVATVDPITNNTTTVTRNAANATVKGLEFEAGVTPVEGFSISGYLGIVDAVFDEFDASDTLTFFDLPFPVAKTTAGITTVVTPIDDVNTGTVSFTANFSYRSAFFGDNSLPFEAEQPEARVPSQINGNISLAWDEIMGSDISAQLWVRNVFDDVQLLDVFAGANTALGYSSAVVGEPRTYGLTLSYRFGD